MIVNRHPKSPWTTETIARLKELAPQMSADAIAKRLRVSRNAVIGKARRLGIKTAGSRHRLTKHIRPAPKRRLPSPPVSRDDFDAYMESRAMAAALVREITGPLKKDMG